MSADITDTQLEMLSQRWADDPTPGLALQLADLYRQRGQIEQAVPILERGLDKHPGHVSLQVALGRCLLETEDAEGAASVLRGVVDKDPGHLVANKLLVRANLALGDLKGAADRLDLYAVLNDGDPDLGTLRAAVESIASAQAASAGPPPLPAAFGATEPGPEARPEADLASLARPGRRRVTGLMEGDPFAALSADPLQPATLPGFFRQEEPAWAKRRDSETAIEETAPQSMQEEPGSQLAPEPEATAVLASPEEAPEPESAGDSVSPAREVAPPVELEAGAGATATLGALYLAQGHFSDARRTFEQVLARDPEDSEARAGLTELELRLEAPQQDTPPPSSPRGAKIARLERYLSRIRAAAERLSA